ALGAALAHGDADIGGLQSRHVVHKSFWVKPADQSKAKLGPSTVHGIAWGGENRITRVEVSEDGGAKWRDAVLASQNFNFAWRQFQFRWTPSKPGYYTLCCRATDSAGRTQPIEPPWNPSGYLWNAIDRLGILVEA
ncbi:MAG: hypothetical protein HYZ37_16225, partial [Candidatus Solibacter usitatus]|nr:hypothetical protein [Candidatus Solibacter usitatus]